MKGKVASLVVTFLVLGVWSGRASFAQGMEGMPSDGPMGHQGMMMGPAGQAKGRMGMHPMQDMMKEMMKKTLVATSDGGVVVMVGNKLMKYDKDLNLVKEVEIKVDLVAMHQEMMEMMKNCPMMKDRPHGPGMGAMGPGQAAMEAPQPAPAADPAAGAAEKVEKK